ncbi:hypothetical protein, partial [Mycobacterium sp. NPDC004974]
MFWAISLCAGPYLVWKPPETFATARPEYQPARAAPPYSGVFSTSVGVVTPVGRADARTPQNHG